GKDMHGSADLRLAALGAVAPRLANLAPELFEYLRSQLDLKLPVLTRLTAASTLSNLRLNEENLVRLAPSVAAASAVELPYLLAAFERSRNATVGKKLSMALEKAPALESLAPDALHRTLKDYPGEIRDAAGPLFKRLNPDADKQAARLTELELVLSGGN